jgi:RNA-directed DNA polymerase
LDGLERLLKEKFPTKKPLSSFGGKFACVNLIRYADDFIITGRTKELLEGEIKPLVEQFLQERGLELSPAKTVITHVEKGFDFLGQNVRKYPNGKLLIKPSKKNIKTFLDGIRKTIKAALGMSAADLIHKLNPKIRGWANYHRHVVSQRTFARVDHEIFSSLWRWARRRHPNKNTRWRKQKYFVPHRGRDWSFFGETCDDEGQPSQVWLRHACSTPIQRHVKIKADANPYDSAYAATCKAAGYDCLTKEEWIKPRISLRVAYEVGAARQQTVRSPRTMYPHSQEWHQNREATVYLPA